MKESGSQLPMVPLIGGAVGIIVLVIVSIICARFMFKRNQDSKVAGSKSTKVQMSDFEKRSKNNYGQVMTPETPTMYGKKHHRDST